MKNRKIITVIMAIFVVLSLLYLRFSISKLMITIQTSQSMTGPKSIWKDNDIRVNSSGSGTAQAYHVEQKQISDTSTQNSKNLNISWHLTFSTAITLFSLSSLVSLLFKN
ncbi:MAG: hypothetical protein P9L93_03560 [Candidatus Gorgyraea atricola]|nr:hypothetical protein [Candidatus Gorgyraea atricola]